MAYFLAVLFSLLPLQEEQFDSPADRLSPKHFKKKSKETFKLEPPRLLEEDELVKEPQELLNKLRDMQQKAWVARKGLKGKAWTNLIRSEGTLSSIFLLEWSLESSPRKTKYLAFSQKRKLGQITPLEQQSPEDKDKLVCSQAAIRTPQFHATGLFLSYLDPEKSFDEIEVFPPDEDIGTFAQLFDNNMFRFDGSPQKFFDEELPNKTKDTRYYTRTVKKRGDVVELSIWYKDSKRPTRTWLFDLSKNGCCVFYQGTVEIKTDFVNSDGHWVPKRIITRGNRAYYETKFFDIEVNPEFPDDEFSYLTLPCSDKGTVYDKINGRSEIFGEIKKRGNQESQKK